PTVADIEARGAQALAVACDVSREADTQRLATETLARFGRIDVLVNNAALYGTLKRRTFMEIPVEEWDRVMAVNLRGLFLCARAPTSRPGCSNAPRCPRTSSAPSCSWPPTTATSCPVRRCSSTAAAAFIERAPRLRLCGHRRRRHRRRGWHRAGHRRGVPHGPRARGARRPP